MKSLLIIGAGGHGKVVKEIAEDLGYKKIDFIDDNNPKAIGKIEELNKFLKYKEAIVGIGNNEFRESILNKLEQIGFAIPTLVHPTAYVSRSAIIEKGSVIEPKAIVNASARIGMGSIISVGSIVDHDTVIGKCAHINAGAIVKAGGFVENYRKLQAGEVVLGY